MVESTGNIVLRQFYESEKKLRLLSTALKLKHKYKEITVSKFEFDWNDFVFVPNDSIEQLVLLR